MAEADIPSHDSSGKNGMASPERLDVNTSLVKRRHPRVVWPYCGLAIPVTKSACLFKHNGPDPISKEWRPCPAYWINVRNAVESPQVAGVSLIEKLEALHDQDLPRDGSGDWQTAIRQCLQTVRQHFASPEVVEQATKALAHVDMDGDAAYEHMAQAVIAAIIRNDLQTREERLKRHKSP